MLTLNNIVKINKNKPWIIVVVNFFKGVYNLPLKVYIFFWLTNPLKVYIIYIILVKSFDILLILIKIKSYAFHWTFFFTNIEHCYAWWISIYNILNYVRFFLKPYMIIFIDEFICYWMMQHSLPKKRMMQHYLNILMRPVKINILHVHFYSLTKDKKSSSIAAQPNILV
jgi:hypothetical protein